jgi:hypothetical protein
MNIFKIVTSRRSVLRHANMAAEQCLREVRVSLDAVDGDDRHAVQVLVLMPLQI